MINSKSARETASTTLIISHMLEQLSDLKEGLTSIDLRKKVVYLVELQNALRKLGKLTLSESGFEARTARERIRRYFLQYESQVIAGDELAIVSGISEYARRTRELRESGMNILVGSELPDGGKLRPDEYMYSATVQQ